MVFQKPLHHHMPKGHQHDMAMRYVHSQSVQDLLGALKLRYVHCNPRDVCIHVAGLLGALQQ